jgi:hypothetical protein
MRGNAETGNRPKAEAFLEKAGAFILEAIDGRLYDARREKCQRKYASVGRRAEANLLPA